MAERPKRFRIIEPTFPLSHRQLGHLQNRGGIPKSELTGILPGMTPREYAMQTAPSHPKHPPLFEQIIQQEWLTPPQPKETKSQASRYLHYSSDSSDADDLPPDLSQVSEIFTPRPPPTARPRGMRNPVENVHENVVILDETAYVFKPPSNYKTHITFLNNPFWKKV